MKSLLYKLCVSGLVVGVLAPAVGLKAFGLSNKPLCPPEENCSKISQEVLLQGTRESYQKLYSEFKKSPPGCQSQNLKQLADFLQKQHIPEECFEETSEKPKANDPEGVNPCPLGRGREGKNQVKRLGQRVFDLVRLNQKEDPLKTQALSSCTLCPLTPPLSDLNQMAEFVKEAVDQTQCSDLKPKQSRRVYSGSGIDTSYKIQAREGGGYEVPLTLQFEPDKDYDGPVPPHRVGRHYQAQAQECLKKASEKMLGPNGEKLNIVIQPPPKTSSACPSGEVRKIKVGSKHHRSHSEKYASDIDCPTITHEVLHLMGLCDNYEEKSMGFAVDSTTGKASFVHSQKEVSSVSSRSKEFKPAFDCRVVKENNIMSNHYERWHNVFEHGNNSSLLEPEQFQALLYGSCPKNKKFNECSRLAYESSVENKTCQEKKAQCTPPPPAAGDEQTKK